MLKILKKILGFIALVLILGGIIMLMWEYFRNKQLLEVLVSNSIVKGSIGVLRKMGIAALAIVLGLMVLSAYFKVGSIVRKNEREREEALWKEAMEKEELTRQLKKEAEDAKAEVEKVKMENDLMRKTFIRKPEADEENADQQPEE